MGFSGLVDLGFCWGRFRLVCRARSEADRRVFRARSTWGFVGADVGRSEGRGLRQTDARAGAVGILAWVITRELSRARAGVATLFFTNGAFFANLAPRYPEIKSDLAMGDAVYGLAVAAYPAGALGAGLLAATLVRRFTSRTVAVVGTAFAAFALLGAGVAPTAVMFAVALALAGAADAITDVGQNAHGLRVERGYGRSIINSFHAVWSLGAVAGGLMAAAAMALDVSLAVHLSFSTLLVLTLAFGAHRLCLPGPDSGAGSTRVPGQAGGVTARMVLVIGALSLVGIGAAMIEDVANSWAALYLLTEADAPAALAAFGFIALIGGQFVGRLAGDGLIDYWGQRAVARMGGGLIVLGFGAALLMPNVWLILAGFVATGFGMATLIPGVMATADKIEGLRPSTGLTVVSWLMRFGGLVASPVIGLLSEAAGLRAALVVVPVIGVVVLLFSGVMKGKV